MRASAPMISSLMPSAKYSWSPPGLMSAKGRTTTEGLRSGAAVRHSRARWGAPAPARASADAIATQRSPKPASSAETRLGVSTLPATA
jgi:hypothetical protein